MEAEKIHSQQNETEGKPLNLSPEDKRTLVGVFALLIKVDKRINPHLYKPVATGVSLPMQQQSITNTT